MPGLGELLVPIPRPRPGPSFEERWDPVTQAQMLGIMQDVEFDPRLRGFPGLRPIVPPDVPTGRETPGAMPKTLGDQRAMLMRALGLV